jgi:hypothetical protein
VDDELQDLQYDLPEEFAALRTTRDVMAAALRYMADLRTAVTQLGDAFAAAGLSASDWRSDDARLSLLSPKLPDVTLDVFMARLTEFATDHGPVRLHGDSYDVEQFGVEVDGLYAAMHGLRTIARRVRAAPPPLQGAEPPLERAMADARVLTPLGRVTYLLGNLKALQSFLAPLAPEEWDQLVRDGVASDGVASDGVASGDLASAQTLRHPAAAPTRAKGRAKPSASTSQHRRLRDFAAPVAGRRRAPQSWAPEFLPWAARALLDRARQLTRRPSARQWLFLGGLILVLGITAAVLALAQRGHTTSHTHLPVLVATPAQLVLACAPGGTPVPLTLSNPGSSPLTWQVQAPSTLTLSATRGTLQAGQRVTLDARAVAHSATAGSLTIQAGTGAIAIPYSVTCP